MEKEYRIRPYYKSELAEAYAPFLTTHSALNRLALWIDLNAPLSKALAETGYRRTQRIFTSRQVALIFEYLGEPLRPFFKTPRRFLKTPRRFN